MPVATSAKDAAHQAPLTNPLNEILTRVASLEAVRFLEPKAGASSKAKFDSHLILKNVKNEIEFKLDWVNRSLTHEPATADRPEAVYVLAHTNRSTHDFGLPEKLVKELGFENLKAEASAGSGEKNKTEVK